MHMREKGLFPLQAKRRMRLQKALRLLFILLAVQRTGGIDETAADAHLARGTLQDLLLQRDPASLKICTMLDKPSGRTVDLEADYVCFTIPGAFVVGCGLDYGDYYRNLPLVGVLKPSVYQD